VTYKARIGFVIAAILLAGIVLVTALWKRNDSPLEVRVVVASMDTNGNEIVTFMATNSSLEVLPHFAAVKTPEGDVPLYAVEIQTEEGWRRTANPTNYSFRTFLNPISSWQFQVPLDSVDRPRRVILYYTLGHRQLPPVLHQIRRLWKNLGGAKEIRELRSEPVPANKIGAANGIQPVHSETNRTSSAAGSRR
jgi:hypothetical protein